MTRIACCKSNSNCVMRKMLFGQHNRQKNPSPRPPAQDANRERFCFSPCTFNPAAASGYATKLLAALLSSQSVGLETKLCISRLFSTGMHPTNEAPSNQQKDVAMNFPIPAGNPYRSCEGLYISLYYPPAECLSNNTHLFFLDSNFHFFFFFGDKRPFGAIFLFREQADTHCRLT